jgi:hypothetical protein
MDAVISSQTSEIIFRTARLRISEIKNLLSNMDAADLRNVFCYEL